MHEIIPKQPRLAEDRRAWLDQHVSKARPRTPDQERRHASRQQELERRSASLKVELVARGSARTGKKEMPAPRPPPPKQAPTAQKSKSKSSSGNAQETASRKAPRNPPAQPAPPAHPPGPHSTVWGGHQRAAAAYGSYVPEWWPAWVRGATPPVPAKQQPPAVRPPAPMAPHQLQAALELLDRHQGCCISDATHSPILSRRERRMHPSTYEISPLSLSGGRAHVHLSAIWHP